MNPIPTNFTKDITLDFQIPSPPIVKDKALQLGIKGNFFYKIDKDPWGERAPVVPWNDPTSRPQFQARISDYSVDAVIKALIDENPDYALNITYAYLKNHTKIYVDTEIANFVMPGISKLYGNKIPMDILCNMREFRDVHSKSDGLLYARANLNTKFLVE